MPPAVFWGGGGGGGGGFLHEGLGSMAACLERGAVRGAGSALRGSSRLNRRIEPSSRLPATSMITLLLSLLLDGRKQTDAHTGKVRYSHSNTSTI